ncbi:hypothetical protein FISHEDRAFT_60980 [Fistulina hepatica ATCC 64428]|uniref:Uncharacterized protein n=1 Tax=Fistulina hepatica ATCC 64428 TaxID=1128425 RepID=A0A0D7A6M9_9AGAR|nr:hypothetical protein FISHEDRAFT_60980 [Fistulina hepatica ATCC 64428]
MVLPTSSLAPSGRQKCFLTTAICVQLVVGAREEVVEVEAAWELETSRWGEEWFICKLVQELAERNEGRPNLPPSALLRNTYCLNGKLRRYMQTHGVRKSRSPGKKSSLAARSRCARTCFGALPRCGHGPGWYYCPEKPKQPSALQLAACTYI